MAFNYFLCEALKYVSHRLEDSFTDFGGMAPLSNRGPPLSPLSNRGPPLSPMSNRGPPLSPLSPRE
jgi:hypothetical protein